MAHMPARGVGKNDSRYWRSRSSGALILAESSRLTTRRVFSGAGDAMFALGTANKEAAAAKATAIWRDLVAHGLEVTLAKHKAAAAPEDKLPLRSRLVSGLLPPARSGTANRRPLADTLGSVHEFLIKMKAETMQRAAKKVFASLS